LLTETLDRLLPFQDRKIILSGEQKRISSILRRLNEYVATEDELLGKLLSIEYERFLLGMVPELTIKSLDMDTIEIPVNTSDLNYDDLLEVEGIWRRYSYTFSNFETVYYSRDLIDELSHTSPLKVSLRGFIIESELPDLELPAEDVVLKAQLWEWFKNPVGPPPTGLISDDEVLIYTALRSTKKFIVVVSDDLKLVSKIASINWRRRVYNIPVVQWITEGLSPESWPIRDAEFLLDLAQIERLLEAVPLLSYGESGWFPKTLSFTETMNVDSYEIFPVSKQGWPGNYYVRPTFIKNVTY